MCIFSSPVERVFGTQIFARPLDGGQVLAYQMVFSSGSETAMILPLPVASGLGAQAVRFINLQNYPGFFADLHKLFPDGLGRQIPDKPSLSGGSTLPVYQVGAFEASYLPCIDDFERLDPRFRLPASLLTGMAFYRDYGFAVFRLTPGQSLEVHPMAFHFASREPRRLFFPTVHVHDGETPTQALFDHVLYAQGDLAQADLAQWRRSRLFAGREVSLTRSAGLIDGDAYAFKRELTGLLPNQDSWAAMSVK